MKEPRDIQPECWFPGVPLPLSISSRLLACRTPEALDDQLERSACTLQGFWRSKQASGSEAWGKRGGEAHLFD